SRAARDLQPVRPSRSRALADRARARRRGGGGTRGAPGVSMKPLSLGFSPCPNDTFLFYALVHGLIAGAPPVRPELYDVETLNRRARAGELALTKVSYGVIPALVDRYAIL